MSLLPSLHMIMMSSVSYECEISGDSNDVWSGFEHEQIASTVSIICLFILVAFDYPFIGIRSGIPIFISLQIVSAGEVIAGYPMAVFLGFVQVDDITDVVQF